MNLHWPHNSLNNDCDYDSPVNDLNAQIFFMHLVSRPQLSIELLEPDGHLIFGADTNFRWKTIFCNDPSVVVFRHL